MEVTQEIVFVLIQDENKWNPIKAKAEKDGISEWQVICDTAKGIEFEGYDYSRAGEAASAIVNALS